MSDLFHASVMRLVRPISNRLRLLISRAIVNLIDDSKNCQTVQVDSLGTHDGIEKFEAYGFTSHPVAGDDCEAIYLSVGGIRDNGVVVCAQNRKLRLKNLAEGEVAIYDNAGNTIVLKQDGHVEITGANKVNVVAPEINLGADSPADALSLASKVLSELGKLQSSLNALVTTFNTHTHVIAAIPVTNATPAGPGPVSASGATAVPIPLGVPAAAPSSVASTVVLSA